MLVLEKKMTQPLTPLAVGQRVVHFGVSCISLISEKYSDIKQRSILNTGGIINFPEHAYDWVRCGIGMYGGFNGEENLKTAITFN